MQELNAAEALGTADPVDALELDADALTGLDPVSLGDAALREVTLRVRRVMDRLDGVFARLAAVSNGRGVGADQANGTTAGWLAREAGMRIGDVRGAIEAGQACELLPATGEAWRAGWISSAAARTITAARVDGHDDRLAACEGVLLGFARRGGMRSLRRAVGHFRNLALADGSRPRVPDGLHLSRTYGGRTVISGEFGSLAAETITTALHAYTDPPDRAEPEPTSVRYAAALVRVCEAALGVLPAVGRPRAQVSVVVDWATLTRGEVGRLDGEHTGPIHPEDVRRLLCDCAVSRVVTGPGGLPIDVGRASRTAPPALRRALVARDGGCRFPRCEKPPGWCDAHHLVQWPDGGRTDLDNSVLLCDRHHHTIHQKGWAASLDPDGTLRIRGPDGVHVG